MWACLYVFVCLLNISKKALAQSIKLYVFMHSCEMWVTAVTKMAWKSCLTEHYGFVRVCICTYIWMFLIYLVFCLFSVCKYMCLLHFSVLLMAYIWCPFPQSRYIDNCIT